MWWFRKAMTKIKCVYVGSDEYKAMDRERVEVRE